MEKESINTVFCGPSDLIPMYEGTRVKGWNGDQCVNTSLDPINVSEYFQTLERNLRKLFQRVDPSFVCGLLFIFYKFEGPFIFLIF